MQNKKIMLAGLVVLIITTGAGIAFLRSTNEADQGMEPGIQGSLPAREDEIDASGSPDPARISPEGVAAALLAQDVKEDSPTPRAALEGTDPSTVNLATGELQLVEFFAFW